MRCAARDLAGRAQFKPVEKGLIRVQDKSGREASLFGARCKFVAQRAGFISPAVPDSLAPTDTASLYETAFPHVTGVLLNLDSR